MNDSLNNAPRVSLLACAEYVPADLDEAIEQVAEFARFPDISGKRILVKPNLLKAATADKAVTTHPEFLAAVLRFLWKRGAARIVVGDSPGFQSGMAAAKTAGIYEAAISGGAEWADFTPGKPRSVPDAKLVKSFTLASVLDECDVVINLPKLKTHRLMNYTGAIKNLFGLIPGLGKSGMHLRFADKGKFGTMLVDLALSIPNCFSFMDGIVAMEGEGPGDGDPFKLGLVLASGDAAALDWTAARCIGYDPLRIPYLVDAFRRTGGNPVAPAIEVGPGRVADVAAKRLQAPFLRRTRINGHFSHAGFCAPLYQEDYRRQADLPSGSLHRLLSLREDMSRGGPKTGEKPKGAASDPH